jgi:hypothetical protein
MMRLAEDGARLRSLFKEGSPYLLDYVIPNE